MQSQKKKKNSECQICLRQFKSEHALQTHQGMIHKVSKPKHSQKKMKNSKCSICSKEFTSVHAMKTHRGMCHKDQEQNQIYRYKCENVPMPNLFKKICV